MKFQFPDVGKHRWLLFAKFDNWDESQLFRQWLKEHYPECKVCLRGVNDWEIRGGDMNIPLMIKLRWL